MAGLRSKNLRVLAFAGLLLSVSTGLVIYSPSLYRAFCAVTGYGGTVRRAVAPQHAEVAARTVKVLFDANVATDLPWEFRPEQNKVVAHIGEPTKVYYYAKNTSDRTIVARAVYNVTPFKIAPYFFKIECFCFTEEKLAPGESARMPLVFYVDDQALKEPNLEDVTTITLSYTFYPQKDLSPDDVAAARDLGTGSVEKDAALKQGGKVGFDNDAPRQ